MQPRLALDIGWRDLLSVLAPPRGDSGAAIGALAPPGVTAVPALSVRTAFDALLAELALPPGAEIAMSAVNIEGMAQIARAHGLVLRPLDLDLATLAPKASAAGASVLLTAHLYGARNPPPRAPGALVVEDCAQAYDGALTLGAGADVALYSFGPIKSATALGGAVALVRDPGLAARLSRRLAAHPPLGDGWFLRRAAKYALLKALNGPRAYGLLDRLIRLAGHDPEAVITGLTRGFGTGELLDRIRRRPPPRLLALLARRLQSGWSPAARRARAEAVLAGLEPPGRAAAAAGWWLAPVLSRDPAGLVGALRAQGFDATRGTTSLRALAAPEHSAPEARRLIDGVVYLPVTPYLPPAEAARLAAAVRDFEGAARLNPQPKARAA